VELLLTKSLHNRKSLHNKDEILVPTGLVNAYFMPLKYITAENDQKTWYQVIKKFNCNYILPIPFEVGHHAGVCQVAIARALGVVDTMCSERNSPHILN